MQLLRSVMLICFLPYLIITSYIYWLIFIAFYFVFILILFHLYFILFYIYSYFISFLIHFICIPFYFIFILITFHWIFISFNLISIPILFNFILFYFRQDNGTLLASSSSIYVTLLFQFSKVSPIRARIYGVQDKLRTIDKELTRIRSGNEKEIDIL